MADRIVVMRDGHILQTGTPTELYEAPVDVFTARFIGSPSMNMLSATALGEEGRSLADGNDLLIGIRSHDLVVGATGDTILTLEGRVEAVEPLGPETMVHLRVGGETVIATSPGNVPPEVGSTVAAKVPPGKLYLFDAKTERSLGRK